MSYPIRYEKLYLLVEYYFQEPSRSSKSCYLVGDSHKTSSKNVYLYGVVRSSKNCYLRGIVNIEDSKNTFLHGQDHALDDKNVYTRGQSHVNDQASSYLNGGLHSSSQASVFLVGSIYDSCNAFTAGNVLMKSSKKVFVTGLVNSVKHKAFCYCTGILRSKAHVCIGGAVVVTKDYIVLTTSDNSFSKKFRVLLQDYDDGTLDKAEEVNRTIGGGIDHSIGAVYKTWSPIIRVRHTEPNPDFGNMADLEYLYSLNNPNGTPSNDLTLTDHHQAQYTVHMVGKMTKNIMGCEIEGECAWFLYRLQLMRVQ